MVKGSVEIFVPCSYSGLNRAGGRSDPEMEPGGGRGPPCGGSKWRPPGLVVGSRTAAAAAVGGRVVG